MPFDHNDHYHPLLLRQLPPHAGTALDVGCGTGKFARLLAARGLEVDAIDASGEAIAAASELAARAPAGHRVRCRRGDIRTVELPASRYDVIACLASIHHVPFRTVAKLRLALAPGGVLIVLGCYRERTPGDLAWSVTAVPVNAAVRVAIAFLDRVLPRPASKRGTATVAPIAAPTMSLPQIRRAAAQLLPGCTIRRLLFWRYLLVFREPGTTNPDS